VRRRGDRATGAEGAAGGKALTALELNWREKEIMRASHGWLLFTRRHPGVAQAPGLRASAPTALADTAVSKVQ
jgi:hypothetical protein